MVITLFLSLGGCKTYDISEQPYRIIIGEKYKPWKFWDTNTYIEELNDKEIRKRTSR